MIISVALCTYNGEKYIDRQLKSILYQTKRVDEIIVCDDFSTDKTRSIIESFVSSNPCLIKFIANETRLGPIGNFEKAISKCTGSYIFLSDQDDIWQENKVEKIMDFFKKHPKALLVFTNGDLINEKEELLNKTLWSEWGFTTEKQLKWKNNRNAFFDLICNDNKVTGATAAFRKSLLQLALPFKIVDGMWHDGWLSLHAAAQSGLFFLPENLIQYRLHSNQQVGLSTNPSRASQTYPYISLKEFHGYIKSIYPFKMLQWRIYKKIFGLKYKVKAYFEK
jgi:glycosyltransferase involved in cell wall biosynthesis